MTPDLNKETLLRLCLAQRMWINIVMVALTLSQLGAAHECGGFVGVLGMTPDQLKKEIQSNVAAALKQGVLNSTLEKVVDVAVE